MLRYNYSKQVSIVSNTPFAKIQCEATLSGNARTKHFCESCYNGLFLERDHPSLSPRSNPAKKARSRLTPSYCRQLTANPRRIESSEGSCRYNHVCCSCVRIVETA